MKWFINKALLYLKETDKFIWLLCILLPLIGLMLQYGTLHSGYDYLLSMSSRNLVVQAVAIGLGVVCALVISLIDYNLLKKTWVLHVPLSYIFVALTFFIGIGAAARAGDKRWLVIPGIQVWVQPAELLKISFILVFAYQIVHSGEHLNKLWNVCFLAVHAGIPVVLIHFQGDDGTALLMATIALTMLVLAGLAWRYLIAAAVAISVSVPLLWKYVVSDFQKERIWVLLNQDSADPLGVYYQQYQSKMAIAMGGETGIGLLSENHIYVPEMHTDFIFSFLAESFGLMGAMGVLILMSLLCLKILYNSRRADDAYGALLCAGVFAMILFQFAINVGMCLSMMPVIGNTFPFLSYGGSSVLTNFLGIGLVLSVYSHRTKGMFDD